MRKEAKSWALVFHTYNPQEIEIRKIMVQSQPQANSSPDPTLKIPNEKQGWESGSSNECLPCKHKALSSSPNTTCTHKILQGFAEALYLTKDILLLCVAIVLFTYYFFKKSQTGNVMGKEEEAESSFSRVL
jgi:hypothetical protein